MSHPITVAQAKSKAGQLLRRAAASKYLRDEWKVEYAPQTLAKFAVIGGGPSFVKPGRFPLYPQPSLDDFARRKLGLPALLTSDAA